MKCAVKHTEEKAIRKQAVDKTVQYMLIAFATYLGDKRGWCSFSIVRALKWINKHAEMVVEDYTNIEEAQQYLIDEYGINITEKGMYVCEKGSAKQ